VVITGSLAQPVEQLIGFEAYGESSISFDPVAQVISSILEHSRAVDLQLKLCREALEKANFPVDKVPMPGIQATDFLEGYLDDISKQRTEPHASASESKVSDSRSQTDSEK
jgi:hypothetical protein